MTWPMTVCSTDSVLIVAEWFQVKVFYFFLDGLHSVQGIGQTKLRLTLLGHSNGEQFSVNIENAIQPNST